MAGNEEIPRDFQAPEILAALRQLQAELAATRADVRTVADRQGATGAGGGGAETSTSEEVQRTTGALDSESSARERNVQLAQEELATQREITAEVERTFAMYAKLAEARGGTVVAPAGASSGGASAAEAQAALASRERLSRISTPEVIPAPSRGEAATTAERSAPALGTYGQELTNVSARQAEFAQAQNAGGAANAQFISQLAKGDITLAEFGAQLGSTIGKFAQWTAAAGGVFAVIGIFDELYKGARDSSSGVSQLQRSIDGLNTEKAASSFHQLAQELNIPIKDASDAVFQFSRTFPTLENAVAAASVGLRAQKVDNVELGVSVQALTAVHQQFGTSAQGLSSVFDMLDESQRRYNARVTNTLQVLSKSSAAVKDAGGSLEQLIQLSAYASRVTGQPGNQIGTAFYRAASNTVQNPKNQNMIKNLGLNPEEAANEFTQFLIKAIRLAAGKSDQWKRELAIAIGGKQQGGKVFEPLLSANPALLNEIIGNVTPDKARGSTQQELGHILEQTDERVKSLKISLEQMGAELERTGASAGLGLVLEGLTDTLRVTNDLLDAFNLLPHPVKELILVLLEAKLAIAGLRATALGSGLANVTGLSFLGPSAGQQASRAERVAQESALTSVNGLQGSTLVREQQLRTQAAVNEAQMRLLAEEEAEAGSLEERLAVKERIQTLEDESIQLSQQGNALLVEQAAQQEVANGLQIRINELRAGAIPAAGFAAGGAAGGAARGAAAEAGAGEVATADVAELVGGGLLAKLSSIPAILSTGLSVAMRGIGVGIIADVGAQIAGGIIGGNVGKKVEGSSNLIGAGAGVGFLAGGPLGAAAGGLLGYDAGLLKETLGRKKEANPEEPGFDKAVEKFKQTLAPQVLKAQAGELSPERLKEIQATLSSMINDPGFEKFRTGLKEMQTQLTEVSKGTTDASKALAKSKLFNRYENIAEQTAAQAKEHIATVALKATTTGASAGNLQSLTNEFDQLAGQYGGGENKEGLSALKEAESKLLDSAKKSGEDLADKAKFDPNIAGKTADYKAAIASLGAATSGVQQAYVQRSQEVAKLQKELGKAESEGRLENQINEAHPGLTTNAQTAKRQQEIESLRREIKRNTGELAQIKKATAYETNQLKAAREEAAEKAFTDISNAIDANSGLAQAQTSNKSVQLHEALHADNEKLKLALELFGKNSNQYKKALTDVLKEQQSIVEQAVTNIDTQGKLEASEVSGTGTDAGIQRAQINLNAQRQELATLTAGKAEPNKIKQLQTQINEAENALGKTMLERSKTITDALAQIKEASQLNPVEKARTALAAAEKDERGLTGAELLQAKATVAQKKASLYEQTTNEKIAQLKYEHDVEDISDNAYISSLEQLVQTRKLANSTKRQLLQEIHQLSNAAASGLELNVGSIKLPSIYEVRRAIAGGQTGNLGGQLNVNTKNEFTITVTKGGDENKVFRAIDKALHTSSRAAARAAGKV